MAGRRKSDDIHFQTLAEIADFFGVSKSTAEEWHASLHAPKRTPKGYSARAWGRWIAKRKPAASASLVNAERAAVKLEGEKITLDRLKGELVPKSVYTEHLRTVVRCFVGILESLPTELMMKLAHKPSEFIRSELQSWGDSRRWWLMKCRPDGTPMTPEEIEQTKDGPAYDAATRAVPTASNQVPPVRRVRAGGKHARPTEAP